MKFEDLRLTFGYPIQLQTTSAGGQPQRFACRLIGCIPGHSVLVTHPRSETTKRLRSGQKLVVRLMVANGIYLFGSSIEYMAGTPFPVLYLAYPKSVSFKQIRGATRVDVNLAIRARNLVSLNDLEVAGVIADISTSGARIEMDEPVGEIGDAIGISAMVTIGFIQRELSLKAVIRSRIERSTREYIENLPAVYGVEFTENGEDNLLVLNGYVFSEITKSFQFTP